MQNLSSKFLQNSLQSFNFTFVYFSSLIFQFIQLRFFRQILLKNYKKKNLENIFQSLIEFF